MNNQEKISKASMRVKQLIKAYLKEAKMMQLATSVDNQPWVCNVWFAFDNDLNIYWFSATSRRHSEDIIKNNKVAAAIVLSLTPKDPPRGLQIQGIAEVLTRKEDIEKAMSVYKDRIFDQETIDELMEDKQKPHKFYRIKPTQIVLFDAVNFGNNWRQEYNL